MPQGVVKGFDNFFHSKVMKKRAVFLTLFDSSVPRSPGALKLIKLTGRRRKSFFDRKLRMSRKWQF